MLVANSGECTGVETVLNLNVADQENEWGDSKVMFILDDPPSELALDRIGRAAASTPKSWHAKSISLQTSSTSPAILTTAVKVQSLSFCHLHSPFCSD